MEYSTSWHLLYKYTYLSSLKLNWDEIEMCFYPCCISLLRTAHCKSTKPYSVSTQPLRNGTKPRKTSRTRTSALITHYKKDCKCAAVSQHPFPRWAGDPDRSRRATHSYARISCESCLRLKEETSLGAKPQHCTSVLPTLSALTNPIGASSGILVPW